MNTAWFLVACTAITGSGVAQEATKEPFNSASPHKTFNFTPSTTFHASGDDDEFSEYGILAFQFETSDFGVNEVTGIGSMVLELTTNVRGFSDGDSFELFFSADTVEDLDFFDFLRYDAAFAPSGIDPSQFNSFESLGIYEIDPPTVDRVDAISLLLPPSVIVAVTDAINNGREFQILIGAVDNADDVTYTGLDNPFVPDSNPLLTISLASPALCADQNGDGELTGADFNAFLTNFSVGDSRADINQDDALTGADFNGWLTAFSQGQEGPTCN